MPSAFSAFHWLLRTIEPTRKSYMDSRRNLKVGLHVRFFLNEGERDGDWPCVRKYGLIISLSPEQWQNSVGNKVIFNTPLSPISE